MSLWPLISTVLELKQLNPPSYSLLALTNKGNFSYPDDPEWNVYNFGNNASIRLVVNNKFVASHPMHLHGHNFNVLAEGVGTWDGKIVHQQNTQRRDVQIVQGNGFIVLQYNADNPGVWPFHCHIAWHVSAGLYINTVESTNLLQKRTIPQNVLQTCTDWGVYSKNNEVLQIDSGLKDRAIEGLMPESPKWMRRS